jgi:hypothetical protein
LLFSKVKLEAQEEFVEACSNKSGLLILARTSGGNVFGAITTVPLIFTRPNGFDDDPSIRVTTSKISTLLSITNKISFPKVPNLRSFIEPIDF